MRLRIYNRRWTTHDPLEFGRVAFKVRPAGGWKRRHGPRSYKDWLQGTNVLVRRREFYGPKT